MIGTILLNRYELLEKIGEGGMGIVYKAKCHLLNRLVAVKILKEELSNDDDFIARFKREATSAASLSYPNIVNVHDVGAENNINFIVMEYINGKTLKQVIKENIRLSSDKTLKIAIQIAKALECAHKNNIIHRDIKPDNILITEDNIVKVADFGIAKVADSRTTTNFNKVIGSAHYFSPEQAKGQVVDYRTDIYSLGVVMYEMLTGQVPYNAESSISVAMMHIQKDVIPPKEIITDIPENLNRAVLKALEKESINRYQTAKEMAGVLNEIKEDSNYKLDLNNGLEDATKVMEPVIVSDSRNDLTLVMSQAELEKPIIKSVKKVSNKGFSKNKKIMIIIGAIILVMFMVVSGKFLFKGPSADTPPTPTNTTSPEVSEKSLEKFVPTLIGSTQDIAEQTIVNNGFLVGNISSDFNDSIAKGAVIRQSPEANTSYEEGNKIDLVISLGQMTAQVTVPRLIGEEVDEAEEILEDLQLKLGVTTAVKVKNKGKGKGLSNDRIFKQDIDPGTLVDIGTEINVSYYQSK